MSSHCMAVAALPRRIPDHEASARNLSLEGAWLVFLKLQLAFIWHLALVHSPLGSLPQATALQEKDQGWISQQSDVSQSNFIKTGVELSWIRARKPIFGVDDFVAPEARQHP
ncbi:hypothetical protein JD844_013636 [Phrynosoma platyrhinos]|uniref:Parathyroid hormone 2 n=1 Tax=Phrynosoma platyrhinos TaxID=52577 RepID=A0ABQ7TMD6_PHRPL|nr:hypothetical protein JD844_013636 [Phrynosoma platyrhinos]